MKKILLPTDFSDNSWNAIKYALQLFKDEKCNFTLLNTFTPIFYHLEQTMMYAPEANLENIVKDNSERRLKEMISRIEGQFNNANHTFSSIAAFNILTAEIEELYKGNTFELVVMGTKGATGLKSVLFGTNTIHTIKNAKYPVLAIPEGFEYEVPHEILFPSDYGINFKTEQIQPIIDIAKQYHSRVNILHVFYGKELTQAQAERKYQLETLFKDLAYLFYEIKNKNIPQAIKEFQIKARINLLVMINNKHSFFENVFFKSKVNQIGFHINTPFLVIPSNANN